MPTKKQRTRCLFLTFNSKGEEAFDLSLTLFEQYVEDTKYWKDADKYVMSREKGKETGRVHFHLALYREKKFLVDYEKISTEMAFDHEGTEWKVTIGDSNGKIIDNIGAAYAYITKDGEFKTNYEAPPKGTPASKKDSAIKQVIHESTTKDEFLENMKDECPEMLVRNFNNVKAFAEYEYKTVTAEYVPTYEKDSFEVPAIVDTWYDTFVERRESTRMNILLLVGPTRIGKTQMIRSLRPHLYFKNYFNLEHYKTTKNSDRPPKYLIFDDFEYCDDPEGWHLSKFRPALKPFTDTMPFTLTDKYMRKMEVNGLPLVIVTNEMPQDIDKDYWAENCTICLLEKTDFCFKKD